MARGRRVAAVRLGGRRLRLGGGSELEAAVGAGEDEAMTRHETVRHETMERLLAEMDDPESVSSRTARRHREIVEECLESSEPIVRLLAVIAWRML